MNTITSPVFYTRLYILIFFLSTYQYANSENLYFSLHCPDDITINCDENIWDLSSYGYAYIHGYQGKEYLYNPDVKYDINFTCYTGKITRTWKAYDYYGRKYECDQVISVKSTTIDYDSIDWPETYLELEGCNPDVHPSNLPKEFGYPYVQSSKCNLIGKTYTDLPFNFEGSCKKIVRFWKVIDWCNYTPNSYNTSVYRYTQVIKITNNEIPEVSIPPDMTVNSFNCKDGEVSISLFEVDKTHCGDEISVINNSPYAFAGGADASGIYPIGTTTVKYVLKYGCGYKKSYPVNITIQNAIGPTPLCLGALSVVLMPIYIDHDTIADEAMIEVWAKEFDHDSYHPCEGESIYYSFSEDSLQGSKVFDCNDLGHNELKIWLKDDIGNQSSCTVDLLVQQNNPALPGCISLDENVVDQDNSVDTILNAGIFGNIHSYWENSPVQNVKLSLVNMAGDTSYITEYDTIIQEIVIDSFQNRSGAWLFILGYKQKIVEKEQILIHQVQNISYSDSLGDYALVDLEVHKDYRLKLACNDNSDKEMINTSDVEVLLNHLNGIRPITDEFLLKAADVDGSGEVTVEDATILMDFVARDLDALPGEYNMHFFPDDDNEINLQQEAYNIFTTSLVENGQYLLNFTTLWKGNLSNSTIESRNSIANLKKELGKLSEKRVSEIKIFPNPFQSYLSVQFSTTYPSLYTIELFNESGMKILKYQDKATIGSQIIDLDKLSLLPEGIYFIRMKIGEKWENAKLIKI